MLKTSYVLVLLIVAPTFWVSQAQGFGMGILLPKGDAKNYYARMDKLQDKLRVLLNESGVAVFDIASDFAVFPTVEIVDTRVEAYGQENRLFLKVVLRLDIKQVSSDRVLTSITKRLNGSGNSEQATINNALGNLDITDKDLKLFVVRGTALAKGMMVED